MLGLVLGLAVAMAGYWVLPGILNSRGVCVAEMKRLSDEELVRIGIDLEIRMNPAEALHSNDGTVFDPALKKQIAAWLPFKDANEFLQLNPRCCTVRSNNPQSGYEPSQSERDFGSGRGYVLLNYNARYRSKDGGLILHPQQASFPLNNCGQMWRSS